LLFSGCGVSGPAASDQAGNSSPEKTTPTISWTAPAAITYGTPLSSAQLDATASVAGTFTYSPAAGTVPPVGTDTLLVTFTPSDTADYNTATDSVSLVVNAAKSKQTPKILWPTPAAITYGTPLSSRQLDATASVAGTFVYSPAAGTVPAVGTDKLSVTFTPSDTTDYNSASDSVSLVVNAATVKTTKTTPSITWATPAPITSGTALSATQLDATASVAGTFVYSPDVGTVPPVGTDTLTVTFTPSDTVEYNTATASVSLVVNPVAVTKTTPTIFWATPSPITSGTALSATQLDATASVPGTFVYSPTAGTVLPTGTNTLSVAFTPSDTTDYNSATASVSLVVTSAAKTTPTITWATPAPIDYGTALSATQLDATASVPGTLVYYPAAGTVPPAGTDRLSVTFTPTDTTTYNSATASVSLVVETVTKSTPTITWATPAPITSGTALSATQLDATASVPGTFVYSPAAGTVPPVGTDTLSVTFTPTDTTTYNTATDSVSLVVNGAAGALSGISCASNSMSGAGSDACTVTLTAAAGSGGLTVSLASSSSAVTVPASVTVPMGASSAAFTATATAVTTAQTAILTATAGGVTKTYTLALNPATQGAALTLQSTSVAFGNVTLNTTATQTVTLTSSGTSAVTISAGAVIGTGFSISGVSFPVTLNPGQTATLAIEFDPTVAGAAAGTVTLTDNTPAGTAVIAVAGTGTATSYEVDLTWDAPTVSTDPVAGYDIYRAPSGSSSYQLLNSAVDASTAYTDTTVANGTAYQYYVTSVDAEGNQSAPSNIFTITIP